MKILVTVNEATKTALDELAERENKPRAIIIREAIEERLKSEGYNVSTRLVLGGDRSKPTTKKPTKKGKG